MSAIRIGSSHSCAYLLTHSFNFSTPIFCEWHWLFIKYILMASEEKVGNSRWKERLLQYTVGYTCMCWQKWIFPMRTCLHSDSYWLTISLERPYGFIKTALIGSHLRLTGTTTTITTTIALRFVQNTYGNQVLIRFYQNWSPISLTFSACSAANFVSCYCEFHILISRERLIRMDANKETNKHRKTYLYI